MHSCMHCGEAQGDTTKQAPHAVLLVQSSVDEFALGLS
jgi:hypothetical protein